MFRETDVLTITSSEKKAAKSSHSILSGELCQLSTKNYISFCYVISLKPYYGLFYATYGIFLPVFYRDTVNGISGKTDLVY